VSDWTLWAGIGSAALLLWGLWSLDRACRRANRTAWGISWLNWIDGLNRIFCMRYHRLNATGLRLPAEGPVIVAANHISGLDPLLLVASSRRPLRFLIAREQYRRPALKWLFKAMGCIPVDRRGRPERAMRAAARALEKGEVVALFPHGKIHLPSDPPVRLKGGAVRLARLVNCPITPARINGVRAQGTIFRAIVLRGRARVESFHPISVEGREEKEVLEELADIIEGRLEKRDTAPI